MPTKNSNINLGLNTPTNTTKQSEFIQSQEVRTQTQVISHSFEMSLDRLVPFKQNPFTPYAGQKLDDLVYSVREHGILQPIIVRPIGSRITEDATYEILSGHNRFEAAKRAELRKVPVIVKEGLDDTMAMLIVTHSNLLQRSFADLSHSERAVTISMYHAALREQGKRSDLLKEVEDLLNTDNINACETSSPTGKKSTSMEKTGEEYALSKNTVARYLRVNKLISSLKVRLDRDEIGIRVAVELSYLSDDEQSIVNDALETQYNLLTEDKSKELRQSSKKKHFTLELVARILAGKTKPKLNHHTSIKLEPDILPDDMTKYLSDRKPKEKKTIIVEALKLWWELHRKGIS